MVKLYTPIPSRYAVIRLDPIATVEGCHHPEILKAAKEMEPKVYLVFIMMNIGLAWPDEPWSLFDVIPIAPCLPPDDGTMTPEMCVPIFPNTNHPSGRMHIRTSPEFPYDNCYHWSHARELRIRVRTKPEQFDDDLATKLEPQELLDFWELSGPDRTCGEPPEEDQSVNSTDAEALQSGVTGTAPSAHGHQRDNVREEKPDDVSATPGNQDREGCHPVNENSEQRAKVPSSASICSLESVNSEHSANAEFHAIVRTGIFGNPDEDKDVYPLVDLWLELVDHLKQDDIPHPNDFYKEYDAIVNLVIEEKRRAAQEEREERLETLKHQADETSELGGDVYDPKNEPMDLGKMGSTSQNKHKRCRPRELIQKLRVRGERLLAGIKYALRFPYIPIWP